MSCTTSHNGGDTVAMAMGLNRNARGGAISVDFHCFETVLRLF